MKDTIKEILESNAPSVRLSDRARMWSGIEAAIYSAHGTPSPFTQFLYTRKIIAAVGILAFVLLGGGATVVAAEAALPGETLFKVEQAIEHVRIRLATNDVRRAQLAHSFAEERLSELRTIVGKRGEGSSKDGEDKRVQAAVTALVRVMEESNMSITAREKLYANLFSEIDSINIDVTVEERKNSEKKDDRVKVRRDETGSKIEIKNGGLRTLIEKRNGEVFIEEGRYDLEHLDEASQIKSNIESEKQSEVRGIGGRKDENRDETLRDDREQGRKNN